MDERVAQSQDVVLVVRVALLVQLYNSRQHRQNREERSTHQVEDGHFHHTLVEVGRLVLDDLDGHNLVRLHVLALDDLAERALPQYIQDQVPARRVSDLLGRLKRIRTCGPPHYPASRSHTECSRSLRCRNHRCVRACWAW